MAPRKNKVGKRFGRLTVVRLSENRTKDGRFKYYCECDCGTKNIEIASYNLRENGGILSCGCLQAERSLNVNERHNQYDLSRKYGIGFTTNTSKEFYFDLEDYEKIKDYHWCENNNPGYIYGTCPDNRRKGIYLHRLLTGAQKGDVVDHINHDPRDNRKNNLRVVTRSKNQMNTKLKTSNTSGFTGVYYSKLKGKWCAQITAQNKVIYLGTYLNKDDAINARKKAEEEYFGEYSFKNSVGIYNSEAKQKHV